MRIAIAKIAVAMSASCLLVGACSEASSAAPSQVRFFSSESGVSFETNKWSCRAHHIDVIGALREDMTYDEVAVQLSSSHEAPDWHPIRDHKFKVASPDISGLDNPNLIVYVTNAINSGVLNPVGVIMIKRAACNT